eukprot:COSAG01_NODE_7872_length_3014_cov_4.542710_1_plen_31_part_00
MYLSPKITVRSYEYEYEYSRYSYSIAGHQN